MLVYILALFVAAAIVPVTAHFCGHHRDIDPAKPLWRRSRSRAEYRRQDQEFFEHCVRQGIRSSRKS